MKDQQDIVIIGGGIIGLCSAYYLQQAGHSVQVIDKGNFEDGCSYGNAGMIVPSHVVPLAAPGMIAQGMRWMLNSRSPFYVRPRLNSELYRWGMQFKRSSTKEHVARSITLLKELSLQSKDLYQSLEKDLDLSSYQEKGLLMLYQNKKTEEHEVEAAQFAFEAGLQTKVLTESMVKELEPSAKAIGGIHYLCDAHVDPIELMTKLKAYLQDKVEFIPQEEITGFEIKDGSIRSAKGRSKSYSAESFVVATGAWSSEFAKSLNLRLPMMAGKGYSFERTIHENGPTIPSILCEGKVAVTPFAVRVRFGGTMEITHPNDRAVRPKRIEGIDQTIRKFYPEMNYDSPTPKDTWLGHRPCSPDGLPYIGRVPRHENVIVASGHGMMGLSLGPATGTMVNQILGKQISEIFSVDRF